MAVALADGAAGASALPTASGAGPSADTTSIVGWVNGSGVGAASVSAQAPTISPHQPPRIADALTPLQRATARPSSRRNTALKLAGEEPFVRGMTAVAPKLAETIEEELWFGDEDPMRSQTEAQGSLAAAVGSALGLKPFPAVASKAMQLLSDPDVDFKAVDKVVGQDPALTTQLMRTANAAVFATSQTADTIQQAVMRLGSRQVYNLVAGLAAMGMFRDLRGLGAYVRDHCAGVAGVSRTLADSWGLASGTRDLFLAALLHDVGKLLSLQVGEIDYHRFGRQVISSPDAVHTKERKAVGYDHAVLGAHVLSAWNMPELVVQAVALHHQPGRAYERDADLGLNVALIRLANRIDYRLQRNEPADEAFIDEVARSGEGKYADFDVTQLTAVWPQLVAARREVAGIFG